MADSGKKNSRAAILDIHSPLYLRTRRSKYSGGDIGDLYPLVDKAARAGFKYLQFLPVQDTGKYSSPYLGVSIYSFNPVFLSVELLAQKINFDSFNPELLRRVKEMRFDHAGYSSLYKFKLQVLAELFSKRKPIIDFVNYDRHILAYATFKALKDRYKSKWFNWPAKFKGGDVAAIIAEDDLELNRKIKFYLFVHDTLRAQWQEFRNYASKKKLELIIDKPIYPIHDSAEVWANQHLFYLRKDGSLRYGSGCNNPRDPFGAQYWGHAVYKFKEYPQDVAEHLINAIAFMSQLSSTVRLDHTLALVWKYYLIDPVTKKGRHVPAINQKLFKRLGHDLPEVKLVAEDLGYVSNRDVDIPLGKFGIPGMRCIQWFHIPKFSKIAAYPENCLALTSNHDLPSLPAWWHHLREDRKSIYTKQLTSPLATKFNDQVWQLVNLVFSSKANLASITLRDLVFDLRRYNKPSTKYSTNWVNREHIVIENIDMSRIKEIIKFTKRAQA